MVTLKKDKKNIMSVIKLDKYLNSFKLNLQDADKELYDSIKDEFVRQQNHIELIASENIVSKAVLEAQGSVLTNKYAEGYPEKDIMEVANMMFLKTLLLKS